VILIILDYDYSCPIVRDRRFKMTVEPTNFYSYKRACCLFDLLCVAIIVW